MRGPHLASSSQGASSDSESDKTTGAFFLAAALLGGLGAAAAAAAVDDSGCTVSDPMRPAAHRFLRILSFCIFPHENKRHLLATSPGKSFPACLIHLFSMPIP